MNPTSLYTLTQEQIERYSVQPDQIPDYELTYNDDYELPQYVKGSSMRFWYNTQTANFTTHWHSAIEIILPIEEGYQVIIQQQEYNLAPGDIIIIPAGELHSLNTPAKGSRLIFLFELDYFTKLQGFSYILSLMSKPIHLTYETCRNIYETEITTLMKIAEEYWSNSMIKELRIHSLLLNFFADYADYCFDSDSILLFDSSTKKNHLSSQLNNVFDYLDTHYSENISLEDIASMAGFSKFYFSRLFKQCTTQTFHEYLNTKRIKVAEQLLIVPNLTITEISLQAGFSSLSSFNRNFKRLKGCTPTEYRNLYTANNHEYYS